MNTVVHKSDSRSFADHGWLRSRHSFSFAGYYNPVRVHFGALRVLNDDKVAGGQGFGAHPHDNMEIISIPLSGDLEHRDSTGRSEVIRQGDVQIMSAGSGLRHSEYNHHQDKPVEFLQIWVFPKERDIRPRYEQKSYSAADRVNKFQTVVSPEGGEALTINQDAWFSLGDLEKGRSLDYQLNKEGNGLYAFVLTGEATIAGESLGQRDAVGVTDTERVSIIADTDTEILLMEVPMAF